MRTSLELKISDIGNLNGGRRCAFAPYHAYSQEFITRNTGNGACSGANLRVSLYLLAQIKNRCNETAAGICMLQKMN